MPAPAVIDALEFARAEQQLGGSLPVNSLKRLDDMLFDTEGSIAYRLRGVRDERSRPHLELVLGGRLHLQCQRCLGLLDYALDVMNTLRVVPRGAKVDEELEAPEAPDVVEVDPELDVADLIEDEILLALPLAPRHPDGECESRINGQNESAARQSAFAKLAALKRPHKH